jgi:C-terminal processing protease CtpA/Prc
VTSFSATPWSRNSCRKWAFYFALALPLFPSIPPLLRDETVELTHAQKQQVIDAVWRNVRDRFYDPGFRGVDWDEVHEKYLDRIDQTRTRTQLAQMIRNMVATLHNSHIGLLTEEEYRRTQNVLPFFFDSTSDHVFVSYVFRPRQPGVTVPLQFGDEIISVDEHVATELKLPSVTWLDPVMSNPYYGPAKSSAALRVRRGNTTLSVDVSRVRRFADVTPLSNVRLDDRTDYLRFLKMDKSAIAPDVLRLALNEALPYLAMIIDLRHCVGGDATVLDVVGGMLLGPGVELSRQVPRGASFSDKKVTVELTADFGAVYKGTVILLVDGNTESGPEALAAALQEYGRAKIVGERTRGAFNGYTEAVDLPFDAGILVVPVDKGISPHGKEYEGVGVVPDVLAENSVEDFRSGRDTVLETARHLLLPQ